MKVLWIGIALVQVFDIVIHAATDQLEAIRVASNLIVLLWLAALATGKIRTHHGQAATGVVGIYLVLNLIFLASNGVTNSGELRVTLFLVLTLTVIFSMLLTYVMGKS